MALFSKQGIDQAIDTLHCQPGTLRARLLEYIRVSYATDKDLDSLSSIAAPALIEELWDVHSADEIKLKRKNLSGLKSSLNKALKAAIDDGGNPDGIIISKDNVFTVSEEKKNSLIDKLSLLGGKESITDILSAVQELIKESLNLEQTSNIDSLMRQLDSTKEMLAKHGSQSGATGWQGEQDLEEGGQGAALPVEDIDDTELVEIEETEEELQDVEEVVDEEATGDDSEFTEADEEVEDEWDSFEVEDELEEIDNDELQDVEEVEKEETTEDDSELTEADEGVEDEWDSFEVEDELGEIDDDELQDIEEVEEEEITGDDSELAEADEVVEDEWDSVEVEDELEEIDDDELQDIEEVVEEEATGDDSELTEADEGVEDEWDSFEVEDELEEIDDDELQDIEEVVEEEATGDDSERAEADEVVEDEWDSVEVEDDLEEIDDDELQDVEEIEEEENTGGDSELTEADEVVEDEWDSFEVEDELEEIDDDELQDVEEVEEEEATGDDSELAEADADLEDDETTLSRSLDLSQYIEPHEALDFGDILQESNEEYVKQILDRFMPKFIKIPAGSYPVGAPKQRSSDRSTQTIELPSFFIGQHPITNDIFDFFIRETGYITSAEKEGYGLVTSNRLHGGKDKDSGRDIIVINQGITTTRTPGANWMHPCGPGSSLEHKGNHPVVQVSLTDAMAFTAWAGKRLPTEDEWEAAARGKEGSLLPWGNSHEPLANLTESQHGTTSPVGIYGRLSLSPFGLLDMIGNIAEWTSSHHDRGHNLIITKGGSWASERATCAQRAIEAKDTWTNTIGFRCCVNNPSG